MPETLKGRGGDPTLCSTSTRAADVDSSVTATCAECGCTDNCTECRQDGCRECWKAHRRRGLAWCEGHGVIVPCVHTRRPRRQCEGSRFDCPFVVVVERRPNVGHAHCPGCWAEAALTWAAWGQIGRRCLSAPPPPCASCRDLVTDDIMAVVVPYVAEIKAAWLRGLEAVAA